MCNSVQGCYPTKSSPTRRVLGLDTLRYATVRYATVRYPTTPRSHTHLLGDEASCGADVVRRLHAVNRRRGDTLHTGQRRLAGLAPCSRPQRRLRKCKSSKLDTQLLCWMGSRTPRQSVLNDGWRLSTAVRVVPRADSTARPPAGPSAWRAGSRRSAAPGGSSTGEVRYRGLYTRVLVWPAAAGQSAWRAGTRRSAALGRSGTAWRAQGFL